MVEESEKLVAPELRVFLLLAIVFATRLMSSGISHLVQVPVPIRDAISFATLSIVMYWVPQVRKNRRIGLFLWLVLSLTIAALLSATLHIVDLILP